MLAYNPGCLALVSRGWNLQYMFHACQMIPINFDRTKVKCGRIIRNILDRMTKGVTEATRRDVDVGGS